MAPAAKPKSFGGRNDTMGTEYRLRFENTDAEGILRDLSRLPGAVAVARGTHELEFSGEASGIPIASLRLEAGGAYFCAHAGPGRDILGRVVDRIVSHLGRVVVEEYEP
jgi:hypothetical protein